MPLESYNKNSSTSVRKQYQQVALYSYELGKGQPPDAVTFDVYRTQTKTAQGYKNPDYKRQIRAHREATTPFLGEVSSLQTQPGSYSIEFESRQSGVNGGRPTINGHGRSGDFLLTAATSAGSITGSSYAVDIRAKRGFIQSAIAQDRAFQGMVFAGELAETLRMIRNPLKAIRYRTRDYYDALRKGYKWNKRADHERALSKAYLEWTYGVAPLFADIEGGVEALKRLSAKEVRSYKRIRSTHSEKYDFSWSAFSTMSAGYGSSIRYRTRTSSEVEVSYYGEMRRRVREERYMTRSQLGFTVRDFVPTLWELLPYSFLIDYFVNVDNMIDNWSFQAVDMAWYSRTIRMRKLLELVDVSWDAPQKVREYNDHLDIVPKKIIDMTFVPPKWAWQRKSVLRSTQAALGDLKDTWTFSIPGERQTMNMLALVRQIKKLRFFYN